MVTGVESCAGCVVVAGFRTMMSPGPVAAEAGMVPVSCVFDTAVVAIAWPRKRIVDPGPKLLPVTWICCPGPTLVGFTPVIVGANAVISMSMPPDGPPPGPGFVTITVCLPNGNGCTRTPVNRVAETNVVVSACGPTLMVAPWTKSLPVTVMTAFG